MKKTLLFLITLYQNYFSFVIKSIAGANNTCRFSPTCSEYAKIQIKEKGALKGLRLSVVRLLKCQPFYKEKSYA